jgi:hypothetical protein
MSLEYEPSSEPLHNMLIRFSNWRAGSEKERERERMSTLQEASHSSLEGPPSLGLPSAEMLSEHVGKWFQLLIIW